MKPIKFVHALVYNKINKINSISSNRNLYDELNESRNKMLSPKNSNDTRTQFTTPSFLCFLLCFIFYLFFCKFFLDSCLCFSSLFVSSSLSFYPTLCFLPSVFSFLFLSLFFQSIGCLSPSLFVCMVSHI